MNRLATYLLEERKSKRKGGLYHKVQVNLAYNSNRIEGSRLTEEQTRSIFETRTIGFRDQEALPIDDIIEASNHFTAFDHLLDTLALPLSGDMARQFHRLLKSGTSDAAKDWFAVGEWKRLANEVGGLRTSLPEAVEADMAALGAWYDASCAITFEKIVEYHHRFETIHPFQDGNGRVGRLIMFRECLRGGVMPFIIDSDHQQFYYRGLREFVRTPGYLLDTCRSAQDIFGEWVRYFYPDIPAL